MSTEQKLRLIRKPQVAEMTGLTLRGIDNRVAAGKFPKPVLLGDARTVGFVEAEIEQWMRDRIAERENPVMSPERASILEARRRGGQTRAEQVARREAVLS